MNDGRTGQQRQRDFIANSRRVLEAKGTRSDWVSCCCETMAGAKYEDEEVCITGGFGENQALEVLRKANRNPVLYVLRDGEILRTHGEYRYIDEHIASLLEV
jgi:hypothetical protein